MGFFRRKRNYSFQEVDQHLNDTAAKFMSAPSHPVFSGTGIEDIDAHLNRVALSIPSPTVKEVLDARGGKAFSQQEFKNRLKGSE